MAEELTIEERVADGAVGRLEAARFLGIGRTELYVMFQRGELPSLKHGRRRLVLKADLKRILAERLRGQRA